MIGFHSNVQNDESIKEFHEMLLSGKGKVFPHHILNPYISIGTYIQKSGYINCEIQSKSEYYPSNEKITLSRQNLLNENFTNKKLGVVRPLIK